MAGNGLVYTFEHMVELTEYSCMNQAPGVTTIFHTREELPNFFNDQFSIQMGELTSVHVLPKQMKISAGLAKVKPHL